LGPALTHRIEWLGIRVSVPEDWQIVRHGLAIKTGRLVLVDRRRERGSLIWSHCAEKPDLNRLVDDVQARARAERPGGRFEAYRGASRWQGFIEISASQVRTNVVHWDCLGKRLLEFVLVGPPEDAERALVSRILQSHESVAPPEHARRWRAFDVDVKVPTGFRLVKLDSRPADVTFSFQSFDVTRDRPGRLEAVVRRMGMADVWHEGDLERLARRVTSGSAVDSIESRTDSGVLAVGVEAGKRWRRLLGLLRVQQTQLWLVPPENAVYVVTTRYPAATPLRPEAIEVRHREEGE
jgi:hypothetical protein